jgi:hypothetical protein
MTTDTTNFDDMNEDFEKSIEIDYSYYSELIDCNIEEKKQERQKILERPDNPSDSDLLCMVKREITALSGELKLESNKEKREEKLRLLFLFKKKEYSIIYAYYCNTTICTNEEYEREVNDTKKNIHLIKFQLLNLTNDNEYGNITLFTASMKMKKVELYMDLKWKTMWLIKLLKMNRI